MYAFIAKRLCSAAVTLFAVLTLIFVLVRVVPGDPAQVILGDQASAAAIAQLRERLGLDRPILVQYGAFLTDLASGDFGTSMVTGTPVMREVLAVLPYTLELAGAALLIGSILGIPLGIWAALNRNRPVDYWVRALSLTGLSLPAFTSGILLLMVFAIQLQWFPVIGAGGDSLAEHLRNLALPALNLGLIMAAFIARVTRSSMLEVLSEDYVRTALAKGVPMRAVVMRHCLRNALIPIVTVIGLYFGVQIGNSVLTEIVFNRPGLGKLIVGALNQRDYTMLQGLIVVYACAVVTVNLLTDLTYGLIDPRVQYR
ncbi:MAG: ABC transporter permease [Rhodomicrobium sp.]|nr:ABC transporter permease [Rhodomicrobium sp.]